MLARYDAIAKMLVIREPVEKNFDIEYLFLFDFLFVRFFSSPHSHQIFFLFHSDFDLLQ